MTNITLTPEQESALSILQRVIDDTNEKSILAGGVALLQGYAGTGKTTVIQTLIRNNPKIDFCLTAPTNKAVKVLRSMNRTTELTTPCMTIYKLLGIRPGSTDEKRTLQQDGVASNQNFRVVIIDECSMVGADLFSYIMRNTTNNIVIYMGDPKQLPPVGETISETFGVHTKAVLNTVMRQKGENPIIALTADIRRMIDEQVIDYDAFAPAEGSDGSGIFSAGIDLESWIVGAFNNEAFKNDNDSFRYLAWRNRTVEGVNDFVRRSVYGETAPRFVPGERLLFRKPVVKETKNFRGWKDRVTVFSTDEESVVKDVAVGDYLGIPCWQLEMEVSEEDATRIGSTSYTVHVIHESGMPAYRVQEASLKSAARAWSAKSKAERDKDKLAGIRSLWLDFYTFIEAFADVQPVYAMTVHRAQGSTFGTVFIDLADIQANRDAVECLKLLYVAASRPRKFLVI